jgi:methylphosphotriester-DNA--protein-cysteine methyltransferase
VAHTLIGADGREYESERPGTLGGHRRSRIYGRLDCPAAMRAIARGGYVSQRVFFAHEDDAIAAGYRPCAVCLARRYRAWARQAASTASVATPTAMTASPASCRRVSRSPISTNAPSVASAANCEASTAATAMPCRAPSS